MNVEIKALNKRDLIYKQSFLFYALHTKKNINRIKILAHLIRHNTDGIYIVKSGYVKDISKILNISRNVISQELINLQSLHIIKFLSAGGKKKGSYHFAPQFEELCSFPKNINFEFKTL